MSGGRLDPERLAELHAGEPARTLQEALAVDHASLLASLLPAAPADLLEALRRNRTHGPLERMRRTGAAVAERLDAGARERLARSRSDTARGWVCFAVACELQEPRALLASLRSAADDPHFAVREWSWMAARPALTARLEESIRLLADWTADPSERVRRFASEALRPRGVWAKRIPELLRRPQLGLPLLEPLRADPARSVQDSVGNWINDAAKSEPEWARRLCARWLEQSPHPATERIAARGLRSLPPERPAPARA